MNIMLGVAIYFIVWWTVLFAVLPWGVRSHKEAGVEIAGTDPGAPVLPHLFRKVIATTIVATIVYFAGYAIWRAGWISLDSFPMPYKNITL
jgi:predicted secreted protein